MGHAVRARPTNSGPAKTSFTGKAGQFSYSSLAPRPRTVNKIIHTASFGSLFVLLWLYPSFSFIELGAQKKPTDYLRPINTGSPRDCLRSFMDAMDSYRELSRQNKPLANRKAKNALSQAIETLNLSDIPRLLRKQKGQETAIYLKEVIDRIFVPNYDKIPSAEFSSQRQERWSLAQTYISIQRVAQGERKGHYLFSPSTVKRSYEFYEKVRHLPYLAGSGQGSGYKDSWLKKNLPEWTKKPFLSLDWWQWLGLFLTIILALVSKIIIRFSLLLALRLASKTSRSLGGGELGILSLIKSTINPLSYAAAIGLSFIALFVLHLRGTPLALSTTILKLLLGVCLIWLAYRAAHYLSEYVRSSLFKSENKLNEQLAPLLSRSLKIFTVIAGILLTIQNLGINVASLLAGLGLGGLAFALAARDTVANLFGSLMIIFDRPFQVGDWIKVGDTEGNVEDIGFRSTRIRTFYNSIVSIPNSEVAGSQIDNMGARKYRRVYANLSITYDTPPSKVEAFLEGIKEIIKANSYTRKDYYHVIFKEYGDSGLIIMVYFYLRVEDWGSELLERQNIYLEIHRLAKNLGIEFAFPTRTLHIENSRQEGEEVFSEKKLLHPPTVHKGND